MQSFMKGSHRKQSLADIETALQDCTEGTRPFIFYQQASVHVGWRAIV